MLHTALDLSKTSTVIFSVVVFLAVPHNLGDLSSLTRD